MWRTLLLLLALPQAAMSPIPVTVVKSAEIAATAKREMANMTAPVTDIALHTVNAGNHNIGVAIVFRPKGIKGGSASHDKVSEVYQVLEGSGTLITGGTISKPQRHDNSKDETVQLNGPGVTGGPIEGGVSRPISKGDMVIIPAGTPHWFSNVQESMTYTVVRVDPGKVVALK